MTTKYILHNEVGKKELDCDMVEVTDGTITLKEIRGCGYRIKGYMRLSDTDYLEVVYE